MHCRRQKNVKVLISFCLQEDMDAISRSFRMKGWKCMAIGPNQRIETVTDLHEVDAILVEDSLNYSHIDAWKGFGLAERMKSTFRDVCVVAFSERRSQMLKPQVFDIVLGRPVVDRDVDRVDDACSTNIVNTLLWCDCVAQRNAKGERVLFA